MSRVELLKRMRSIVLTDYGMSEREFRSLLKENQSEEDWITAKKELIKEIQRAEDLVTIITETRDFLENEEFSYSLCHHTNLQQNTDQCSRCKHVYDDMGLFIQITGLNTEIVNARSLLEIDSQCTRFRRLDHHELPPQDLEDRRNRLEKADFKTDGRRQFMAEVLKFWLSFQAIFEVAKRKFNVD